MLMTMMKGIPALLIITLLTACANYQVKDAGDGVYYAESPPEYTYVNAYGFGWTNWYGSFYSPFHTTCWHTGYVSRYCHWQGSPYTSYAYHAPPYYGDFAVRHKYPVAATGGQKDERKRVVMPITPGMPVGAMVDSRSLKYGSGRSYESAKAYPGKSSNPSPTASFGKRSIRTPRQSYSRPARSIEAPRSRVTVKQAIPRKLD